MVLFKCRICGGTLEIESGQTVGTCEHCGTRQTLPKLDDERRANLYDRANHFRRNNEFDKAMGIYEQILNEDKTDAEAYWSLVLCHYGIEYVEDPSSHKRIPTVNRAQYTSIFDDNNYRAALRCADSYQKVIYEEEAKAINEIQKGILTISQMEDPFDVFICYKETDNNGRRTPDSVLAQDLYYQLKQEGFKVFFARITLEDKLGSAYEPYIFAALNSAKVMVVLGTKPEFFKAVWVRNEWSRYLALIKQGQKKMLIPAYKDMDPYDLPEEFSHLQAQDMAKLGFMQDLIRGIKKITQADSQKAAAIGVVASGGNAAPLLKRAFMFLEDGDWGSADEYCEKVLDIDPECAEAYLGKLMVELRVKERAALKNCSLPFDKKNNYQKIMRFGDKTLKDALAECITHINVRNENDRMEGIYVRAERVMSDAKVEGDYRKAAELFDSISSYKDSAALAEKCRECAVTVRNDFILKQGKALIAEDDKLFAKRFEKHVVCIEDYERAAEKFRKIPGWRDADEQLDICQKKIEELKIKAEEERIERERRAVEEHIERERDRERQRELVRKAAEANRLAQERRDEIARQAEERRIRRKKTAIILSVAVICIAIAVTVILCTVIIPNRKYDAAVSLVEAGRYEEAEDAFWDIENYKDSKAKALECRELIWDCRYADAVALMESGAIEEAVIAFQALDGHKDSGDRVAECKRMIMDIQYNDAVALMAEGKYEEASVAFAALGGYKDSSTKVAGCTIAIRDGKYNEAVALMNMGKYQEAIAAFSELTGHKDSSKKIKDCQYLEAVALMEKGNVDAAYSAFRELGSHKDAAQKARDIQWANIKVGDCAKFGVYEQDNNTANGPEDIEWIVLEKKNGKILVISKYALDAQPYHTEIADVTWETCTLRKWLNSDFINAAFTAAERTMISRVTVSADKNPRYPKTDQGNATQDKVFLLSVAEADRYFPTDDARVCVGTEYMRKKELSVINNSLTAKQFETNVWWLRTSGHYQTTAAYVELDGEISGNSAVVKGGRQGVRPVLWIDLNG